MFEDVLEEKNGERVAISKRLEALFEEFPVVSKETRFIFRYFSGYTTWEFRSTYQMVS